MLKKNQEYLDLYIQSLKNLNKSQFTIVNYRSDINKFLTWFEATHHQVITKCTSKKFTEFENFLSNSPSKHTFIFLRIARTFIVFFLRGKLEKSQPAIKENLSINSKRRAVSSIKNFFDFLGQYHQDNFINKFKYNPVQNKMHAITLKDKDIEHTKTLSKLDFKKINELTTSLRDRVIIHLLYKGGLRLSEVSNLSFEAIDFNKKSLYFVRKGGSRHHLHLYEHEYLFELLLIYTNRYSISKGPLFRAKNGKALTSKTIYNIITRLLKRAELTNGHGPHSFRKGCATNLYQETKDLLFVRDYLNHSNALVTQTYIDTK
jgi:integrase/recombinase XerD